MVKPGSPQWRPSCRLTCRPYKSCMPVAKLDLFWVGSSPAKTCLSPPYRFVPSNTPPTPLPIARPRICCRHHLAKNPRDRGSVSEREKEIQGERQRQREASWLELVKSSSQAPCYPLKKSSLKKTIGKLWAGVPSSNQYTTVTAQRNRFGMTYT